MPAALNNFGRYLTANRVPILAAILAAYLMILPTMAYTFIMGDDWLFEFDPRGRLEWYYGIGRVGHDYVRALLAPLVSPHYSVALYVAGMLACGITLAYLLRLRSGVQIALAILLFVMFPLQIENMSYKDNHVPLAVAYFAASAFLILLFGTARFSWKSVPAMTALLLCAILTHQATAIFIATAFIAVWLVEIASPERERGLRASVQYGAASSLVSAPIFFALIAYHRTLVVKWPIPHEYLLAESLNRTSADFIASFNAYVLHVSQFYFYEQHLIPLAIKVVFLVLAAASILAIVRRLRWAAILPVALLVAACLTPWSLGLVRNTWTTYKYTAVGLPASVLYPAVFALFCALFFRKRYLYPSFVLAGLVVLLSFQQLSNVTFAAKTTADRDAAITNRILSDIEGAIRSSSLATNEPHAIVVDGENMVSMYDNGPPFNGLRTAGPMSGSSMLCGTYSCNITKIPLALKSLDLSYHSGRFYYFGAKQYEWEFRDNSPVAGADAVLSAMPPWPADGSIRVEGQTVFVKIGDVKD